MEDPAANGFPAGDEPVAAAEPDSSGAPTARRKAPRRLRPDVAAALAARKLEELYSRPVEELEPDELARMKAAFFRS